MKRLLFTAFVMFLAFQLQAQKNVSKYSMEYMKGKTYDVGATEVKNGNFSYYVDCASWEREDDIIGIVIDSKSLEEFIEGLRSIESKFTEWTNTAKENGVTDYDKDFDVKLPAVDCYFKYGDFHFAFFKKPKMYFKITSNGDCLAILSIRDLTASDNRYIDHKGLFIAFSSVDEIESFIEAINPQHALKKEQDKSAKDDLFN